MINDKENINDVLFIGESKNCCAFTGHRELGKMFDREALQRAIHTCLEKGIRYFLCGMAKGFDLVAANELLKKKVEYPDIFLIACIPFEGQSKGFSLEEKKLYKKILAAANKIEILQPFYIRGCLTERDKYMAEKADTLIAFCHQFTGGTVFTIKYFRKIKPDGKIIYV